MGLFVGYLLSCLLYFYFFIYSSYYSSIRRIVNEDFILLFGIPIHITVDVLCCVESFKELHFGKSFPVPMVCNGLFLFSSRSFIVSGFTLRLFCSFGVYLFAWVIEV